MTSIDLDDDLRYCDGGICRVYIYLVIGEQTDCPVCSDSGSVVSEDD